MLLHNQSQGLTKYGINCLAIGLALIFLTFISNSIPANAENITVNAEIPSAGLMSLTIYGNDSSETPSNVMSFTGVQTSDSSLFERNSSSGICDLEVSIQTNSEGWNLTQSIDSNQLVNGEGSSIDLYWKTNEATSYSKMGSQISPDILNNESDQGEYVFSLDYALDAPSSTPPGEYGGTVAYTLSYN
ncbi:MAG: hypothetical protein HY779_05295 [Rubrobacteridae bacterium]|nr:hypothetical protein [Rubrobacteridae bacterium]